MSSNKFIFVLSILAACHTFLWSYLIPPAQVMDEEAHFAYIDFLAIQKHIPLLNLDFNMTKNWRQSFEATGFSRVRLQTFEKPDYIEPIESYAQNDFMPGTYFSGSPGGPPLYYVMLAPVDWLLLSFKTITRLYCIRFIGIFFAITSAFLSWKILVSIDGDSILSRTVASITALEPTAHFLFGGVTNDSAFIFVCALASLLLVSFIDRKITLKESILLGIFCGVGYWIKPYAVSFTMLFFLALLLKKHEKGILGNFISAVSFSVIFLIVVSPWLFFAYKHYGGNTAYEYFFKVANPPSWIHIFKTYMDIASLPTLFSQAFGVFGWLDTVLPKWIRAFVALFFIVGWFSFLFNAVRKRVSAKWIWLAVIPIFHTAAVLLIATWLMRKTGYRLGLQGRYLLYPLAGWIAPFVYGLKLLLPFKHIEKILLLGAFLLAIYALGFAVIPRYYL